MNIAGCDISTHAIDIVHLDLDTNHATWNRYELQGNTALERVCSASTVVPRGSHWDNTILVAIERPYGPGRDTLFHLHVAVGCVTAALPERLRPPWMLHPSEWRKACGLSGKAQKEEVFEFAYFQDAGFLHLPQDAADAYAIATAARNINQKGIAA